jgi:hypothetical protein
MSSAEITGQGLFPTILLHFLLPWRSDRFLVHRFRDESCGRRVGQQNKFRSPQGKVDVQELLLGTFFLKRRYSPSRVKPITKNIKLSTYQIYK